jgi:hypothetical protein
LLVKGRAPMTGYSRGQFGPDWPELGNTGCDARNRVLARDLKGVTYRPVTGSCVVETGTLAEPYRGITIHFQRGTSTSGRVQIDHVVALGDAWQTGAQQWTPTVRLTYANDLLVLLAVDGPVNAQKGDADAASWLPPNKAYRCSYVARQVSIKLKYRLWVTAAERDAIARILTSCPGQALPAAGAAAPAPIASAAPNPSHAAPGSSAAVYYANCAAVRAAGKAPLLRDQPGYRAALDGDGNGVACQ